MGASFEGHCFKDCEKSDLKNQVENMCSDSAHENGHGGYTGTWAEKDGGGIIFVSTVFDDHYDVKEYMLENSDKWGYLLAAKFKDLDGSLTWYVGGWCSS